MSAQVTLLITHFNRSKSLDRLLHTLTSQGIFFENIIVSDDGSCQSHLEHLHELKAEHGFQLIESAKNKGLGHNINKGQDAVKTPLTLYIQEDFVPTSNFKKAYEDAVELMYENDQLDIIRFFSNFEYPYKTPYKYNYSKMFVPLLGANHNKIYLYSDNPHLRRSDFLQKFGRYLEGIKSDRTEYWMCVSFIQKGGQGLIYNDFKSLFQHINTEEEPSQIARPKWNPNPNMLLSLVKKIYRQFKYNFDLILR